MLTKNKAWRSETYLAWVKQQPSCISERPSDDAHHIKGHGFGGTVKAPDWAVIPLTREEHTYIHNIGATTWERTYGSQLDYVARTLGKAIQEGIIGELK
jgi:hypothetical protein